WRGAQARLQEAGLALDFAQCAVWRAEVALASVVCAAHREAGAARGCDAYL
ncbi:hypothetical protein A2U01_0105285, partial [Trifolium medium]|nr:hypothetical protein [Trifolium medium]